MNAEDVLWHLCPHEMAKRKAKQASGDEREDMLERKQELERELSEGYCGSRSLYALRHPQRVAELMGYREGLGQM